MDGNLDTSRKRDDAPAFIVAIIDAMEDEGLANEAGGQVRPQRQGR